MKIGLSDEEIENFKCDVCGKNLDIHYYTNYWMEIKGVYRKRSSFDNSNKFINVICYNCWHKAFPNIDDNSKSAKTAIKRTCLDEIGELYNYD